MSQTRLHDLLKESRATASRIYFMPDTTKKVLIFTATYNERDNIILLLEGIWQVVPQAEILVIDDNSPDGTGQVLDDIADKDSRLLVQHRSGKMGVGSAHREAITFARRNSYDALITMDADFSHDPWVIPQMLHALDQNYDYIVGSRFVEGSKIDYVGFRRMISIGANILARGGLGITCRETTTSFRCFSRELLQRLPIDQVKADGYSFFLECTFLICRTTRKILEIPIHFQDRRFGQSKISKNEIYRGFLTLARLTIRRFYWIFRPQK